VGGGTVLGYQAFYERYSNKKNSLDMQNMIKSVNDKIDVISEKIDSCNNPVEKSELLEKQQDAKNYLNKLLDIHNNYYEKHQGLTENSEKSKKLFEAYNDEFTKAFNEARNQGENLEKSINDIFKKFMDDNFIINKINEFKDYLSTLSITEICLVINISSSIFIFTCLVSIIFAVYGNFLIDRLSLEKKYPKLAFVIRLRVKLQHTYVITNSIFILVSLILMIIVNLITLMDL
jgi:hypothetical protein